MTERDRFAAAAMTGILARDRSIDGAVPSPWGVAHQAYEFADAMLIQRRAHLAMPCPKCGAKAGKLCRTLTTNAPATKVHVERGVTP